MGKHHLVGLVGPAGAGKDTSAGLLVVEHEFFRVAFAERLRNFVRAIDPAWAIAEKAFGGYENAKRNLNGFRDRLIEVGDAARAEISIDVWVDALDDQVEELRRARPVVVSDVRRENEAEWVRDCGGSVVAVYRAGHSAEDPAMARMMLGADFELHNSGTPEQLAESVRALVTWLDES